MENRYPVFQYQNIEITKSGKVYREGARITPFLDDKGYYRIEGLLS